MAATFNTGTQVAPGNNYTPNNVTNPVLVWIAYARRPGPTTLSASNWLFGATSMTEAPNTDVFNDIAGGGDPVAACATLPNPSISSQTLDVTWSNTFTAEFGYAITITGGKQTSPVSDSNGAAYSSAASPSLSYTAPDNSVVIYWRIHAQATSTVWTDPTGFTRDFSTDFVTSPSFRTFAVWYKEVSTGETASVSATADLAGDGGVHGFIVVDEEAGSTPVSASMTGTGAAALTTITTFVSSPNMTAVGTLEIIKQVEKSLGYSVTGTPQITKEAGKVLSHTATGTSQLNEALLTEQSANMTATGSASAVTNFILASASKIGAAVRKIARSIVKSISEKIAK